MSEAISAEALYTEIRAQDRAIAKIEGLAIRKVRAITGYDSVNVGSFGLSLNLINSDLDLSIGVLEEHIHPVCKRIRDANIAFKQTRETRPGTVRHVFEFMLHNILIDLAVMRFDDMQRLIPGLVACRQQMTEVERIDHVYKKYMLKSDGRTEEYATFKLEPYIRFCPGFSWLPIL